MGMLAKIRRMSLRDGLSIREISRVTGLSRNTVRGWLRQQDVTEPKYPKRSEVSVVDAWAQHLEAALRTDQHRAVRERRTAKALFEQIRAMGYKGSYPRVVVWVRRWREQQANAPRRAAFVPMSFELGEAFQFDWSEDWAYVGGERIKLQVAHIKLSHSRAFLVRAYLLQTHEMLFDAHWHAFRVFEGVPGRGIYDNMKTAVDKVGLGKKRDVNARFKAMTSHYVFDPEFCNPAAGWEKGQVEKNVRDARHRMWQLMPAFPDLAALNIWLEDRCKLLWTETAHGKLLGSIADVWEAEKPTLMPLPIMFDGFVEDRKRVSPTCLISFDRTRYSVPASFANRPVSLRIYPERLVVVAEGHVICTHERIINRSHHQPGRVIYDWRHYLAVVQRKPGALRNGAPFGEMPEPFRMLQAKILRQPGGDREMVDILSLVLHHDEQAVLCAVELALEAGVPTKTHVLNLLHRLLDGKPTDQPDVNPPAALSLSKEPEANVARYDGLRIQKGTRHAS